MRNLICRENYIKEYLRVYTNIDDDSNELHEGLISTVFGGLKMLLKKDWVNIKCKNPSVLEYLKEIDKSLSGYTMIKMEFSNECNIIRQNIADYFNDILDYKLSQIENIENVDKFIDKEFKEDDENKKDNSISKILNLKDDTLLDSLKKYKDNIFSACKKSPKLREYADQMLNSVIVFVNDIVINELEKKGADEKKLEKKRKKLEEERKNLEEKRKSMDELAKKAGEESLKKLSKERDKALTNLGVKLIGSMPGDKAVDSISKQFNGMMKEFVKPNVNESVKLTKELSNILKSDTYIGIQACLNELDFDCTEKSAEGYKNKLLLKVVLNKINTAFGVISNDKELFKEVPSTSVQAMMVGISNAVMYGFFGEEKFKIDDNRLSILTKCAIDSDATIGFNLPLIDAKKPENGNFFVSIMNQFKGDNISSKDVETAVKSTDVKELKKIAQGENIKVGKDTDFVKELIPIIMKDFRQNMAELFDKIVKEAGKLKDKSEAKRKAEAAKMESKSKSEV